MSDDNSSASEGSSLVDDLLAIFPDVDREVAISVLGTCNNNLQQAVEELLGTQTETVSVKATSRKQEEEGEEEDMGGFFGDDVNTPTSPVLTRATRSPSSASASTYPVISSYPPRPSYFYGSTNNSGNTPSEDESELEAAKTPGFNMPGRRHFKHKDLPYTHPLLPLLHCFAGLAPLANFAAIDGVPKAWNINTKTGICEGQFAEAFLGLTRMLWQEVHLPLTIRDYVDTLRELFTNLAPDLAGTSNYDQPDYVDISRWIMNALENDLNLKTGVVASTDDMDLQGCADETVAARTLEKLKATSSGIITDVFRGLQKTAIVCPDCSNTVSTFEAFSSLRISTDPHQKRVIEVTYVPAQMSQDVVPCKYRLQVTKSGHGADLKRALIERAGLVLSPNQLVITDVYNGRVFAEINDNGNLDNIRERDVIVIYEIPSTSFLPLSSTGSNHFFLVHRVKRSSGYGGYYNYGSGPRLAGNPMCISRSATRRQLYHFVWNRFKGLFGFDESLSYDAYLKQLKEKENPTVEAIPVEGEKGEKGEKGENVEKGEDVEMGDAITTPCEQESEEERAARLKKEQEERDAEFARKLQAELQEQDSRPYYSSAWSRSKSDEEQEQKIVGLFALRYVSNYGTSCSACDRGWSCNGCILEYNDDPFVLPETGNLSVDWNVPEEELPVLETSVLFSNATDRIETEDINSLPTIFDSLNVTLGETVVSTPDDPYYCVKCKEMREATKKVGLWELPEIFVLQLSRLEQSRWFRSISSNFVDFPMEGLDLGPYVINPEPANPCVYDLTAVLNVASTRTYSTFIKNKDTKMWYAFDGTGCHEVDEDGLKSTIVTPEACVLFYQRIRKVKSLKDVCLLQLAKKREQVDTSLLPTELREAIEAISPTDVRYFL